MVRIIFLIFISSSIVIVTGCSRFSQYPNSSVGVDDQAYEPVKEQRVQNLNTSIASNDEEQNERGSLETVRKLDRVVALSDAVSRVVSSNPVLASYSHHIASADALVMQAGLMPNPQLQVEVEEFGGNNDGLNRSEATISLVQPLQLGGKRDARSQLAEAQKLQRSLEVKILVSEIITQTQLAFNEVIYTQAVVDLLEGQVEVSKALVSTIRKKLTAGSVLPVEKTKAEMTLRNDELVLKNSERDLEIARYALSTLWNGSESEVGDIQTPLTLGNAKNYLIPFNIEESPQYQLAISKITVAEKRLGVQRAQAIPDASIGLGYRRLEETDTNTYVGLFSIDLPVANRNQGGIESAIREQSISKFEGMNSKLRLRRKINSLQTTLRKLLNEHRSIKTVLLPTAQKAFSQAKNAYQRGRTSYLELLDAQRTLVQTKRRKFDVLRSANEAQANITNIKGEHIRTIIGDK